MISNRALPNSVPLIHRCRGFYAYTARGERYLDLFRENGTLVSGHRIKNSTMRLKNFIQKGMWGRYPGIWGQRAQKHLHAAFPGYSSVSFYPCAEDAITAIREQCAIDSIFDPAVDSAASRIAGIWRPFFPVPEVSYLIPWLPYSGSLLPVAVMGPEELTMGYSPPEYQMTLLPSLISHSVEYSKQNIEEQWKAFEHPLWRRRGPYIVANVPEEEYSRVFEYFLGKGIILSPSFDEASVLPDTLSSGDRDNFLQACEELYGTY